MKARPSHALNICTLRKKNKALPVRPLYSPTSVNIITNITNVSP